MGTTGGSKLQDRLAAKAAEAAQQQAIATASEPATIEARVYQALQRVQPEIARALPRHVTPERLARIAYTTIRYNPALLSCSVPSLIACVMLSAQLGLEPGPLGHCYLVPFRNKHTGAVECQFIIGYRGYLELAWRSGTLQSIAAREVCANDEFELEFGLDEKLRHKPALKSRGDMIGVYGVAKFRDGAHLVHWLNLNEIDQHRARSKSPNDGPWVTDYVEMAKKTVIRSMSRYLPLSPEVQRGIASDETVLAQPADLLGDAPIAAPSQDAQAELSPTPQDAGSSASSSAQTSTP